MRADDTGLSARWLHLPLGVQVQLERRARSWSQRELAELLGVSPKSVERWERGRNRPHPWALRRLRELLAEHPLADPPPVDSQAEVDRRAFLERVLLAGLVPAASPEPWDRLLHALSSQAPLDESVIEEAELATERFHAVDSQVPARTLFDDVLRHVDQLAGLLERPAPARLRRRLTVTAGESAVLAGWMAWEMGAKAQADRLYQVAAAAAADANEQPLLACVLAYRSYWAAGEGRCGDAIELLQAGRARVRRGHPMVTAWLAAREAEEEARRGDASAVDRLLEMAWESFAASQASADRAWVTFLDETRLESFVLSASLNLGRMGPALAAAERVRARPAQPETKRLSWILADMAELELRRGDQDAGLHHAREAIAMALRTEARQGYDRLARLRSQVEEWGNPSVRQTLTHELQGILPA